MNNLVQRSLTGISLVVVIITLIMAGPYGFLLLCLVINIASLIEFYGLVDQLHVRTRKVWGIILSAGLLVSSFLIVTNSFDWQIILINIPLAMVIFFTELYIYSENPFQNLAFTFLGIVFITVPLIFFCSAAFLPFWEGIYQQNIIVGIFLMIWANDSAAYLVGSAVGKKPLFFRVSPNKTWEGSVGGAMITLFIAFVVSQIFSELSVISWILLASLIIVFGTFGDLTKSLLKRTVNVKDSGSLLPGHGGFLDRFDSLFGSAPATFSFLAFAVSAPNILRTNNGSFFDGNTFAALHSTISITKIFLL